MEWFQRTLFGIISAFILLNQFAYLEATLDLNSISACYGIFKSSSSLHLTCQTGTKIAISKVYALSKPKSSGCPRQQTTKDIDMSCCKYDENDCSLLYDGEYRSSYDECNGKSSCTKRASWMESAPICNVSVYLETTQYMKIDYYCVPDDTLDPCSDVEISHSTAFLYSSSQSPFQCNCLITPSCEMEFRITVLIFSFNQDTDICGQFIVYTCRNTSVTKDCNMTNGNIPALLFNDFESFLSLKFVNNVNVSRGHFLIQIEGLNQEGRLMVSCGKSVFSSPVTSHKLPVCQIKDGTTDTNIIKDENSMNVKNCNSIHTLNCTDPICLPEWHLNEFFYICPDMAKGYVDQGFCAVFSEQGERVTFHEKSSCRTFNSSRPEKRYKATDVINYPTCIKVDTENRCYIDDPECRKPNNVKDGLSSAEITTPLLVRSYGTRKLQQNLWFHILIILVLA